MCAIYLAYVIAVVWLGAALGDELRGLVVVITIIPVRWIIHGTPAIFDWTAAILSGITTSN